MTVSGTQKKYIIIIIIYFYFILFFFFIFVDICFPQNTLLTTVPANPIKKNYERNLANTVSSSDPQNVMSNHTLK